MAASLNRAGFDVVAPDWIGHGDSEYFGDPQAYSWDSYIKCLTAVAHHCHAPPTHYVGTSWGAGILFLFLLGYKILPRSVTFVDMVLRSTPALGRGLGMFQEQSKIELASVADANAFLKKQRPEFARVPDEYKTYFDEERFARRDGRIRFKFDPAILPAFSAATAGKFDLVSNLKRIRFNALFLYGASSPYRLPLEFMTACARMPHIRYRDDLPGGHPPTLLHEEQFAHVVDFIESSKLLR
jgi:pimeloyl-ACP methyl ester carboxylesterase